MPSVFIQSIYLVATLLFVLGLKMLSSPEHAQNGNLISAIGMGLAIAATLFTRNLSFHFILTFALIGALVGCFAAKWVAMTAMPEMVALFNGSGGIASLLVGWSVYHNSPHFGVLASITTVLTVLIGGITFTGSLVAWGKLSQKLPSRPFCYNGQKMVNLIFILGELLASVVFCMNPAAHYPIFIVLIVTAFMLGVLLVMPIGGGDMPVVISLLNSYSGLAACAAGLAIQNTVLIIAGAMVGAAGMILTSIMCKAMNRSLSHVLFSGFGAPSSSKQGTHVQGEAKPISAQDAYYILEAAASVVFVPGYGMAVAQAQHAVRELAEALEKNGTEVSYAIHPVAGRMPGHMNVLLAEANVPYDQLIEMDDINPNMANKDVALVVGANDVVNPAARKDPSSPIYGMPIVNVDQAKTVIVLKRSLSPGFSGIENQLFFGENTRMLFGDAKASLNSLVSAFKK